MVALIIRLKRIFQTALFTEIIKLAAYERRSPRQIHHNCCRKSRSCFKAIRKEQMTRKNVNGAAASVLCATHKLMAAARELRASFSGTRAEIKNV